MRLSSGCPPLMAALCGLAVAMLSPAAEAQERTVATDVPSCREYADPAVVVTLTRPTEVPQLLAASWNGATHQQADDYLNRDVPFAAPVLARGLPTRLDRRDIGPRNWFRPGTDNAFQCPFQTAASAACSTRASAPEGTFITLLDLLAANPVNRFQATVTVTEEFVRPVGETPPPVAFPASQTLRRSPNQVGVPAGSVRWIYTATASLMPNCQGRPTGPLFQGGVPTQEGRAYLAGTCTPINGASLETLYGWNAVQRYAGSALSRQFKIRALPGRVLIPRSSAFKSVAERACLALPQVAAQTDQALRCDVGPAEFTAWNRALVPATVAGLAPADLTAAAQAAAGRLDAITQGPTCADAERIAAAQAEARRANDARAAEARGKDGWRALAESRGTKLAAGGVALLALVVALALVLWDRARQRRADQVLAQARHAQDVRDDRIDQELTFAFQSAMLAQPFFAKGPTFSFTKDVEKELEVKDAAEDPLTRARVVHLTMQALGVHVREQAQADQAKAPAPAGSSQAPVPPASRLSMTTPPEGISTLEAEGAHAFFRWFMAGVYSDVRAGNRPEFRTILDRASRMPTTATKKEWEALAGMVTQHVLSVLLRGERLELTRADLVKILGDRAKADPSVTRKNALGPLTRLHAELAALTEILDGRELMGDKRLAVLFEERFSGKTVDYGSPANAPPAQGSAPPAVPPSPT